MAGTDVTDLRCWRCGGDLSSMSLPLSRRDMCRHCAIELHVCRMCVHFDPQVARQCREDDAEDVSDKERANFCEWFEPSADAWRGVPDSGARSAEQELAALFGDSVEDDDAASSDEDPWARIRDLASDKDRD